MDLRRNQIISRGATTGGSEIAARLLERRFPHVVGRPIVAASAQLTLEKAMRLAAPFVTRRAIDEAIQELRRL